MDIAISVMWRHIKSNVPPSLLSFCCPRTGSVFPLVSGPYRTLYPCLCRWVAALGRLHTQTTASTNGLCSLLLSWSSYLLVGGSLLDVLTCLHFSSDITLRLGLNTFHISSSTGLVSSCRLSRHVWEPRVYTTWSALPVTSVFFFLFFFGFS